MKNQKIFLVFFLGFLVLGALVWLVVRGFSSDSDGRADTYEIGRDSSWYPLDLRGREKNMVGFSNDLIQSIANVEGFRVYVYEVGPTAILEGLDIGSYDGVFSSLPPTLLNQREYEFSKPFYLVGPVLIVRSNSNFSSLEDLKGRIVGVESSTLRAYTLRDIPDIVLIPFDTGSEALEKLSTNAVDGVILDALRAYVLTEGFYNEKLRIVTSPITDQGIRLVSLKNPRSLQLITRFNDGLKKLRDNGTFNDLLLKWRLIDTEIRPKEPIDESFKLSP